VRSGVAGQRGWVSVRDESDGWRMVTVYEDGWCEAPIAVPTAADTRRRLRVLIGWMVVVVGLFAGAAIAVVLAPAWLSWVLLAASVGAVAVAVGQGVRRRAQQQPPVFASAAEHAAAVEDAARVPLASVRTVAVQRHGHEDVVTVGVRKGRDLVYRSPDRTLGRLFETWSPAPPRS